MSFNFMAVVTILSDLGAHISIFCTCMDDIGGFHILAVGNNAAKNKECICLFKLLGTVCVCVCV